MTITKIEKQKKNNKRYNLYIDKEFFCGIYDDTILKFGIASGDELTEKELSDIRDFDEYMYGKKIAFDYLSYRIRTIAEIKKKLKSKKLTESNIERVIQHLTGLGLVNDEEFARQLINEKIKNKFRIIIAQSQNDTESVYNVLTQLKEKSHSLLTLDIMVYLKNENEIFTLETEYAIF